MSKRKEIVMIKAPKEFVDLIDRKRMEKGYNNRERMRYMRELAVTDADLDELFGNNKKRDRGGRVSGF